MKGADEIEVSIGDGSQFRAGIPTARSRP